MTNEEVLDFITDAIRDVWSLVKLDTFFVRLSRGDERLLVAANQDT
jgi:hypothetical protein